MPSQFSQLVARFERNEVGASVRALHLGGLTVDLAARAVSGSFHHRRVALGAERTRTGAPRWRLRDGTATPDASHPNIVWQDFYLHEDGGCVRILPHGDPRCLVAPAGAAVAIKSVLFIAAKLQLDAQTGTRTLVADVSFANEAFRVADDGTVVPKSRRSVYGMDYDRASPRTSHRLAEETLRTSILALVKTSPDARLPGPGR
jgi:hypothetical protein